MPRNNEGRAQGSPDPWFRAALVIIVVVGLAFRLWDLAARNLWTDEAWVALSALQPTPAAALDMGQTTPPFYLLGVWSLAHLFGGSEWALRSLSLLFGVGSLAVFWVLARRVAPAWAALMGLAAMAFSPIMVYYSKELKQYSGDAFWALLIFLLAERLLASQGRRGWVALGLAGAAGLGFSHPLIFILPVALALLWWELPPCRRGRTPLVAAGWAAAFAALYLLFTRREIDPLLVTYWGHDFPDFSGVTAFVVWLGGALYRYFWYFLGEWGVYWGPPLLGLGIYAAVRQKTTRLVLYLGGPLLLALGAAALHRYPFMAHYGGNRLMLFSAPMLYLLTAFGAWLLWQGLVRHRLTWLAALLSLLLLYALHPITNIRENLTPSMNRSDLQPLVRQLERELKPGDWIYVYYHAIAPFKYYYRGGPAQLCYGLTCVESGLRLPVEGESAPRRVWLIAGHFPDLAYMRRFAAGLLGEGWQEAACHSRDNAALLRFEPQGPASGVRRQD